MGDCLDTDAEYWVKKVSGVRCRDGGTRELNSDTSYETLFNYGVNDEF